MNSCCSDGPYGLSNIGQVAKTDSYVLIRYHLEPSPNGEAASSYTHVPSKLGVRSSKVVLGCGMEIPMLDLECLGQGEMPDHQAAIFQVQVLMFIGSAQNPQAFFFYSCIQQQRLPNTSLS